VITPIFPPRADTRARAGLLPIILLAACVAMVAGCGSTKVYTADKTIVYSGALYNMGNVQRITSRVDGQLPDGTQVDMRTLDKKGVEALLRQSAPVTVSAIIQMDNQEMLYQRAAVVKYSDYDRLSDRFEDAIDDINDFMADKKKTQLKLK
jgi:hypothetical protein